MQASLLQCVGSGCRAAGQKRASLNPDQNNHHSTCCKVEELQICLILHPKPLAVVLGQCSVRNSLKGMSLSSCALASAQPGAVPLPSQRNTCCKGNENERGKWSKRHGIVYLAKGIEPITCQNFK